MAGVLSEKEIKELAKLGKDITVGLSCDINDQGIPCRTDRFATVDLMKRYLEIHGYDVLYFMNEEDFNTTIDNLKEVRKDV